MSNIELEMIYIIPDIYEDNYTVLWTGSGYFGTAHMTVNYTAGNEITTDCVIEQEDIVAFECAIIDRTGLYLFK